MAENNSSRLINKLSSSWDEIESTREKLLEFAVSVSFVLLLIVLFVFRTKGKVIQELLIVALILLMLATFVPQKLKQMQKSWMVLALLLGELMTNILLTLIYFLVLLPISTVLKLRGQSFLDVKVDKKRKSYWLSKKTFAKNKKSYLRQF